MLYRRQSTQPFSELCAAQTYVRLPAARTPKREIFSRGTLLLDDTCARGARRPSTVPFRAKPSHITLGFKRCARRIPCLFPIELSTRGATDTTYFYVRFIRLFFLSFSCLRYVFSGCSSFFFFFSFPFVMHCPMASSSTHVVNGNGCFSIRKTNTPKTSQPTTPHSSRSVVMSGRPDAPACIGRTRKCMLWHHTRQSNNYAPCKLCANAPLFLRPRGVPNKQIHIARESETHAKVR